MTCINKNKTCTYETVLPYMRLLLHVASDDYRPVDSQPVTFNSAPSQMCISITIFSDFIIEPNELFTVMLESTDPAVQLTLPTASITILDSCKYTLLVS